MHVNLKLAACGLLLSAVCALPALAQARPDPFGEEVIAIRARHIETVSKGVINDGIVVIRNGKITAVGPDAKIPPGARILIADTVMPGIVGAYSQIGLSPAPPAIGAARAVANPHYKVQDELYPFDENYARLARYGVTTLALIPGGRGIAGQGAIVRTQSDSIEKMPLVPNSPLSVNFAPNTQTIDLIRQTFDGGPVRPAGTGVPGGGRFPGRGGPPPPQESQADTPNPTPDDTAAQRQRQRPAQGRPTGGFAPVTGSLEARREPIQRALQGTIPTFITCPDPISVVSLQTLLQPYDTLKPVYILATGENNRVAALLGGKKASVVMFAVISLEPLTVNRINMPAILAKAGAKVALRPLADSPEGYQTLRFQVGELIRGGLDRDTALKSITLAPAEMLGLSDRLGSIETGRDANLILLDGDPFLPTSRIRTVLLEGKTVYEE